MPPESQAGVRGLFVAARAMVFPLLIVASVLVIIAPLPAVLMDLLLACNITLAVVIMLTTIYVRRPLEFSVFPSILLGTTLARLVLNVASTRLILTRGAIDGTGAAGGVIEAFGNFVAGGEIAIGLILFIILVAIQFLVITKGATRISEVAARFALDGMPGKQMAIDADLNAGIITQEQAKKRREEVAEQADFYGAMDGASKFVRGDAIASIVITLINIIGGLFVGMVNQGMDAGRAAEVFTKLTIGDGLVSQVPAFLISLAAGLIVTRTSGESNLPRDVMGQLFRHPEAMFLSSAFLISMAFTGLPAAPMLILGVGSAVVGFGLRSARKAEAARQQREAVTQEPPPPKEITPERELQVRALELELGVGLLRMADPAAGGDLLDRISRVRVKVAEELGIILPKVHVCDNIRLDQRSYRIKLRDAAVASGEAWPKGFLAIDTGATAGEIPGMATTEPAFGRPAKWIELGQRERAEMLGYSVVEPSAVLVTHLMEIVREHAHELLSRQQVHHLLENLRETAPKLVDELIPDVLKIHQLHQVLCNLLREHVPVRDLELILETLGNYAEHIRDLGILTEYVRTALARTICRLYRDEDLVMRVVTLDPALEDVLSAGIDFGEHGLAVKISPQIAELVAQGLADRTASLTAMGCDPVVLCSTPTLRAGLKQITSAAFPRLVVLSLNEITRDTQVESVGQLEAADLHAAAH